jgi:hypothetical protein
LAVCYDYCSSALTAVALKKRKGSGLDRVNAHSPRSFSFGLSSLLFDPIDVGAEIDFIE